MPRPDVIARAGRASCTMAGRSTLHAMADDGRRLSHFVSRGRACVALLAARCRLLDAPPGRALLVDDARRSRDVARAAAASFRWWWRRRRRPPLRRVSGDVVTAGLNSSRVWFGPVPGSPRSFRAGMRCRARF
ncbi:hypothetical protein F511_46525 [Dorcoceras hygrometricum]|uniref:Uncharacterized protein n=1 Tax=Dorcoceras hygrometricum TaxID=472368 RepID=A0A2Z7A0P4_9LAMI|nr:hypothetical protein F511_46525 [Dorcoceras hygrometricum]